MSVVIDSRAWIKKKNQNKPKTTTDESMSDGLTYLITGGQNTAFKKISEYRCIHAGKPEQEKHLPLLWVIFPLPSPSLHFFLVTIRNGLHHLRRAAIPTEFLYLNCTGEVCYFKKKAFPSFGGFMPTSSHSSRLIKDSQAEYFQNQYCKSCFNTCN